MGRTLASLKGGKGCPEPSRPGEEELERLAVASMRRRRMLQEVEGVGEEQTMVGEALYQEQFLEGEIQQTLAPLPALEWCQWLNISACSPSVSASQTAQGVDVVLYNPLPWLVRAPVRVPVRAGRDQEPWTVTGPHALCMQSQLVPVSSATLELQRLLRDARALDPLRDEAAEQELVFQADLPPLGYAAVSVKRGGGPTEDRGCLWDGVGATHAASEARSVSIPLSKADGDEETLENDRVSLVFSKSTGLLTRAAVDGLERELSARLAWYNSSDGLESKRGRGQASGAYVFRPNGRFELPADGARVELELVRGPVVQEARQRFADWAHLTTRIYAHSAEVEVEWSVGPIPDEDGLGKEVVVEYSSNLDNGAEFWTDSNGHRMMRRVRDEFEPWTLDLTEQVARNYYPAAAAALIRDEAAELAVIVDRAQGASGQRPGALELMLHRRILRDDDRGVEEALNETACACTEPCPCVGLPARGFHRVLLQAPGPEAAKQRRLAQQRGLDAPLLFFAARSEKPAERDCRAWSALSKRQTPLPEGVHVLTLDGRADDRLLLRLVNVLEPPGQALAVDLGAWVEGARWARVRELSLTANRDLSAGEGGRLARGAFGGCNGDCADVDLKIELEPLQIRTFEMYPEAR
ncbi:glycosyl hydrolase [Helicosporidium sp. ATCC 50920]|nr:glycosyl hydrolase [Helicosporidium sp. ATCC 50920]|eukprot:KDD74852.1 glycosyl hydrolase [Helicosporidium sp. ATCC 50920]